MIGSRPARTPARSCCWNGIRRPVIPSRRSQRDLSQRSSLLDHAAHGHRHHPPSARGALQTPRPRPQPRRDAPSARTERGPPQTTRVNPAMETETQIPSLPSQTQSMELTQLKGKTMAGLLAALAGAQHPGHQRPAQAGADLQDPRGADREERPDLRRRRARDPARGLRLPALADLQLPAGPGRHLRLAVPDQALRLCTPATRSPARCARPRRASATSRCCASRRSTSRVRRRPRTRSCSTT